MIFCALNKCVSHARAFVLVHACRTRLGVYVRILCVHVYVYVCSPRCLNLSFDFKTYALSCLQYLHRLFCDPEL